MNEQLAALMSDVYTITGRPDLVAKTQFEVRAATLKCHQSDFFYKDIFETGIKFNSAAFLQTLEYRTLIPNFRAPKYVRKSDVTFNQGEFLTLITPDAVVDEYTINREDVVYFAGLEMKIRCKQQMQYFLLGCYVHPNVTVDNYYSWIAEEHPLAIIYSAVAGIFKSIGLDERVKTYQDMATIEIGNLMKSNIVAHGM